RARSLLAIGSRANGREVEALLWARTDWEPEIRTETSACFQARCRCLHYEEPTSPHLARHSSCPIIMPPNGACNIPTHELVAAAVAVSLAGAVRAQDVPSGGEATRQAPAPQSASVTLSAAQLFRLAGEARVRRDFATAETAYD